MKNSSVALRVGTRSSELARIQTRAALKTWCLLMPDLCFEEIPFSSPGDRDLATDLRESPADFFTQDLDQAVLSGAIDCAVHSAKDVPDPVSEGLDWFWLPWRADARDVIVLAKGKTVDELPANPIAGISSERREAFCKERFPGARFKPIRGNIQERLDQLDSGEFDIVIMAAAALIRLSLEERIAEWISLDELPTPEGQGTLALTFKAGNPTFLRLRSIAVNTVTFAGGGAGKDSGTVATIKALSRCDVCLHDTLLDHGLLQALPKHAKCISVGKRCARHSVPQAKTTQMITTWVRRGARVVRLKGGDPGIFGRLAEEVEALDALHLPYRVLPGVTSLSSASSGTGILLTRRGLSRGFCVMTPREQGGAIASVQHGERAALPVVFFMSISASTDVVGQLLSDGHPPTTPAAIVFSAGTEDEFTLRGTLEDICGQVQTLREQEPGSGVGSASRPGLFIVGEVASYAFHREWGALENRRVLLTCSEALQERAAGLVADYGGIPLQRPLIRLTLTEDAIAEIAQIDAFDWVVLTSPSSVNCFLQALRSAGVDLRKVPNLLVCGTGTARALSDAQLPADAQPTEDFSTVGTLETAKSAVSEGARVLRLRSEKAGPALADGLRALGAVVTDCVLYRNEPAAGEDRTAFDAVFFASASAVEVFDSTWGREQLEDKTVVAIGKPTLAGLESMGVRVDVVPMEATVNASIEAFAAHMVNRHVKEMIR